MANSHSANLSAFNPPPVRPEELCYNLEMFYHVYNRGNSKQKIFKDAEDYKRFMLLLYLCNNDKKFKIKDLLTRKDKNLYNYPIEKKKLSICAYVLMSNHYHLLLNVKDESKNEEVGQFIKKLSVGYSAYFNKKYNRTGTLFETSYKSVPVDSDEYLKYLFSYINLNPIKVFQSDWKEKGIKDIVSAKKFLRNNPYSSYIDWFVSDRPEAIILNKDPLINMFEKGASFEKDIFFWLETPPVRPEE